MRYCTISSKSIICKPDSMSLRNKISNVVITYVAVLLD